MSDVYFLLFEQGTWRKDSLKLLFWTNIKALSKINKERQSDWVKMLWKTKVKRKVIEMHLEIQEANNILENILENMIVKSSKDPYGPAARRKIDQLYACVRYCEEEFRCRRTMQLEFFGETFDKSNCNKTCDNCKAGREPDRRDLTSEAQTILRLFDGVNQQKRGHGVTLTQLTDLYRGSKSQSAVKFLDTSRLQGYGAGSKFKKLDADRIVHAMIFDRIINESSVQNKGGFSSDYVNLGENAAATSDGRRRFMVDFPNTVRKPPPPTNSSPPPRSSRRRTTSPAGSADAIPAGCILIHRASTCAAAPLRSNAPALLDPDQSPRILPRLASSTTREARHDLPQHSRHR